MPRVKRAIIHVKKRRNLLKRVKGYRWGRKNLIKQAKVAAKKAGVYAYRDRRKKKTEFRQLWQIKINAACRENGTTYSKFIYQLKKANVQLDRKILALLAEKYPEVFAKIVESVK
jgi:large subunit ribosomal protein L20